MPPTGQYSTPAPVVEASEKNSFPLNSDALMAYRVNHDGRHGNTQGRELGAEDIGLIQGLLAGHRDWGRTRLSGESRCPPARDPRSPRGAPAHSLGACTSRPSRSCSLAAPQRNRRSAEPCSKAYPRCSSGRVRSVFRDTGHSWRQFACTTAIGHALRHDAQKEGGALTQMASASRLLWLHQRCGSSLSK